MPESTEMTTAELLSQMQRGWDDLQRFIASLTPEQLTELTDAAGWTVKDHLMHLAVWEDDINALLRGENRRERMGVSPEVWHSEGFDDLNAAIQQRHKDKTLADVLQTHADIHQRLVALVQSMSDADLLRPSRDFNPEEGSDTPVYQVVIGDTYGHYADHVVWMDRIANGDDHEIISKADLLSRVETGWNDLQAYLATLTDEQMTTPTDPAGWTAKDHVAHLAIWEDSINALFDRVTRWQHMGIDRALWESADWDKVNAVIQQRYKGISLRDLQTMFVGIHERLVAKLQTLWDADLQHAYNYYQPESTIDRPALHWVIIDTYQHYDEHRDYIDVIVNGSKSTPMTRDQLLARIEQGWNEFQAYLATLTYEQVTIPTDAAGWTVKDHLAHLAVWEEGLNAMLDRQPRSAQMGIDPALWGNNAPGSIDKINAVIHERYKNTPLQELHSWFFGIHERLVEKIKALSDEDLQRPYREYQTASTSESPIIRTIIGDTYEHYEEHQPWIAAIVAGQENLIISRDQLLTEMENGWNRFSAYISGLSDEQLTVPTDAAGWTAKDHIAHLAVWEDGIWALLEKKSRHEQMGLTEEVFTSGDYDRMNGIIQQRYRDMLLHDVLQMFRLVHERLIEKIKTLTDDDLKHPYSDYQPGGPTDRPVVNWIGGNTFGHYDEHKPWIDAIVNRA